jgi:WD40 repeat protein
MIVAGSYEKLLYGLEGSISDISDWSLKPVFIFPAHVSCIKAVAASSNGKWLATGSADEIIKVWDLKRRKEVGGLMHHEGMSLLDKPYSVCECQSFRKDPLPTLSFLPSHTSCHLQKMELSPYSTLVIGLS